MADRTRGAGILMRLRPLPGGEAAMQAHLAAWHRGPGRMLPGTRLHVLLDGATSGDLVVLHLFDSDAARDRVAADQGHRDWLAELEPLLQAPPRVEQVAVRWNAAVDARPRVAVSIDRDVHATVQDLIGRLIDRHHRTPAEDAYLNMLQSIADDYEREFAPVLPEEGDPR